MHWKKIGKIISFFVAIFFFLHALGLLKVIDLSVAESIFGGAELVSIGSLVVSLIIIVALPILFWLLSDSADLNPNFINHGIGFLFLLILASFLLITLHSIVSFLSTDFFGLKIQPPALELFPFYLATIYFFELSTGIFKKRLEEVDSP